MKSYERLVTYTNYSTGSNPDCTDSPSNPDEWIFAKALKEEMETLGFVNIDLDENCYLMGEIPSNIDNPDIPVLGLISHIDVSCEAPFENIKPQISYYKGGELVLNSEKNISIHEDDYPELKRCVGKHLLHTDGTTLLGADDKAGIASILTMAEALNENPSIKHGKIMVAFTPDEEIGRSSDYFDIEKFGADGAYTVDGGAFGECQSETFNAMSAYIHFNGVGIHPGSAKGRMINANRLASEFDNLLPQAKRPEYTEGYEGFYHLMNINSDIENGNSSYILRSFNYKEILEMKKTMENAATFMNSKYGEETVTCDFVEEYHNMSEIVEKIPALTMVPCKIIEDMGVTPDTSPIRGGTDGAFLSFKGLPCPNLGTGGYNFHSRQEFAVIEEMNQTVELLVGMAETFAKLNKSDFR